MTLTVIDMMREEYDFCCLIPQEGRLSDELTKRGIPYILMGDQTLPTGVKGKQVIFRYGWMSLKNIAKSLKAIRSFKPEMLYCPGPAALPWSAVCGSLTHKPVIWHLHHIFLDGATKKLLNMCGKWKTVKKIIAVSNCVGDQITNESAYKKVEVLYNPVDYERYSTGDAKTVKSELEEKVGFSLDESKTIIGHIALIQRSKRQDFVLDVIAGLKKQGLKPVGIFAGEARESEYLEEVKQKATSLGIYDQVVFLGRRNDVPDLLNLIDVLMIPSAFEGFPLAGLEAASAGVPVAACNVAGAEEFIRVSGDGECFEENDVQNAINAINQILANKGVMIKEGKKFASNLTEIKYKRKISAVFKGIG